MYIRCACALEPVPCIAVSDSGAGFLFYYGELESQKRGE